MLAPCLGAIFSNFRWSENTRAGQLHGAVPPDDPKIWELSRFAIESDKDNAFGFSSIAMRSIFEIVAYGNENKIEQYVTITTTAVERMLRKFGIVMWRFGDPVVIGVENAVALFIDVKASFIVLGRSEKTMVPISSGRNKSVGLRDWGASCAWGALRTIKKYRHAVFSRGDPKRFAAIV